MNTPHAPARAHSNSAANHHDLLPRLVATLQSTQSADEQRCGIQRLVAEQGRRVLGLAGEWLLTHGQAAQALPYLAEHRSHQPHDWQAVHNHAEALRQCGQLAEAAVAFEQAIALRVDALPSRRALVDILEAQVARLQAAGPAMAALAQQQAAGLSRLLNDTASLLYEAGDGQTAWALYRRALAHQPDSAAVLSNLANVLRLEGRLAEAEDHCRRALALQDTLASAWNNLGNVLVDQGRFTDGEQCFNRALALDPSLSVARSNRDSGALFQLLHSAAHSDAEVFERHRAWGARLQALPPQHGWPRWQPGQVMRVAYLSADFRQHAMSHYLAPLLEGHDRQRVQVTCYVQNKSVDEVSLRLRGLADAWVPIHGLDDAALVERIRADGIHVLIDGLGHTQGSRLAALAHKPAPVQMEYLGYLGSTGLPAMDYRLSDEWLDPPGLTEAQHTEQLLRIAGGVVCYAPHAVAPAVGALPALRKGQVCFGSLNKLDKLNLDVVRDWAAILRAVPGSRLLLKTRKLADAAQVGRIQGLFEAHGIEAGRLDLRVADRDFLSAYHDIDIALDPFPFGGGATTCDALWMGVPVITRPGTRSAGRLTHAILHGIGCPQWSAPDREAYIALAVAMAQDLDALAAVRAGLRERMRASPLLDARGRARHFEDAYEQALRAACAAAAYAAVSAAAAAPAPAPAPALSGRGRAPVTTP